MAHRTLDEVRAQFLGLQREVGRLASEALRIRPTWRMAFSRLKQIHGLEERLAAHLTTFMNIDADLAEHAQPRGGANESIIAAAQFQMHFGVRDSVRGLLSDTNGILASIRNEIAFRRSVALAVAAIFVSVATPLIGACS